MYQDLQFRISSELKNIIGKDLISDDFSAIFELVKNSFDAHASQVEIIFKDLFSEDPRIIITDNGKGMNYNDIINKWLFVAYSAKKDGSEDKDYRGKIKTKRYYAGAKGIGRFSCDKLGEKLKLLSKKDANFSKVEEVLVDWNLFEENPKSNFIDISIKHRTLNDGDFFEDSGTIIEISNLRNDPVWDRGKILKLKHSLGKLINPFEAKNERDFRIKIVATEFLADDISSDKRNQVNGFVRNNILDILKLKTTKIVSAISLDSKTISTELISNGELVYEIEEENRSYPLLGNILVELFFLDKKAKINFTKVMGLRSSEYGSVFLYKNGIRIYPFGEPGEDSFSLDSRRAKRMGSYIGTNDVIGRIEILGDNIGFIEASSRGDGLVKNSSYNQLMDYFINKVVKKLESYRINIVRYGIDLERYSSIESGSQRIVELISDVSDSDTVISTRVNDNMFNLLDRLQSDSSNNSFKAITRIEKIAKTTENDELYGEISKIKTRLNEAVKDIKITGKQLDEIKRDVKEKETENLFLKSLKNKDSEELVSLMHHIGISSGIIKNSLAELSYKIDKKIEISNEDIHKTINDVNFENQKILSISRFATKANFRVNAENQILDLIAFIREYISNIAERYFQNIKVHIEVPEQTSFSFDFKPLEMIILIDNLISNSRKAKSKNIYIKMLVRGTNQLYFSFIDDGIGIPKKNIDLIFNMGHTTTGGSGLGLNHIKEILSKINSSISITSNVHEGTKVIILFNKK